MRTLALLSALSVPLVAQFGVYRIGDYSVQVSRYTNHDFGVVSTTLPTPPQKLDGLMVIVVPAREGVSMPDRIDVTVRYRDATGRVFSRLQSLRPAATPQFYGTPWFSGDVFYVGSAVTPISVTIKEVKWSSVEESPL